MPIRLVDPGVGRQDVAQLCLRAGGLEVVTSTCVSPSARVVYLTIASVFHCFLLFRAHLQKKAKRLYQVGTRKQNAHSQSLVCIGEPCSSYANFFQPMTAAAGKHIYWGASPQSLAWTSITKECPKRSVQESLV